MPYHRPTDLKTALEIAAEAGRQVIAGGTDVFPAVGQGTQFGSVLDVTAVPELSGISTLEDGSTRIGAATSWSAIVQADLPPAFDALKQAGLQVGSVQIQNAGTLAGNLCNASPAADGVPPLMALDALVEVASTARGIRQVVLSDFILGPRQTALASDELVTGVIVPAQPYGARSAFEKLGSRTYLVISIAMVAVQANTDANGALRDLRIAVGACSPVARRLPALEARCTGMKPADIKVTEQDLAPLSPIGDVRASAEYRLDAVAELCQRAIRAVA